MVYYLIHCGTHGCVNFEAIIGIGTDKQDILELLYNYYNMMRYQDKNYSFEKDTNDVQILSISESDYQYLQELYINIEEDIEQEFEKIGFKPECQHTYYWWLILHCDNKHGELINDEQYIYYQNILKRSENILI